MAAVVALAVKRPNLPVEYSEAVRNLVACATIDEAKYWSDKADALAAWAQIYENDQAGLEARRLKLHAYRRMGELAREIRPGGGNPRRGGGAVKGPVSLLVEKGLKTHQANQASAAARMPAKKFDALVSSKQPPVPSSLLPHYRAASEEWKIVSGVHGNSSLMGFAAFCRRYQPKMLAKGLTADERKRAEALIIPVARWLKEFDKAIS